MRDGLARPEGARAADGTSLRSWAAGALAVAKGHILAADSGSVDNDLANPVSKRREDIQALRALAVMAVVAYHLVPSSLPGGFVGVDVFFVVSGYLVGGALVAEVQSTGRVALRRFYARRIRRIAPLAVVVAAATIVVAAITESPLRLILWGSPVASASITRDGMSSVLGIANLWFGFSDAGYVGNDYVSPYLHYWSLGVEEQFYLVAPFAIVLAFRAGRKVGTLAVFACSLMAFDLATWGWDPGNIGTFYNPISRSWELGVGVLVAITVPRLRTAAIPRVWVGVTVWLSWLGLALCALKISTPYHWPTPVAIVPVMATATILAAGVVRRSGRLASLGVLQWLGDRSYGIYLWHWPVIVLLVPHSPFSKRPTLVVAVVIALLLSAVSYSWIERPVRHISLGSSAHIRRVLVGGMVIILSGLIVVLGAGVRASTSPLATSLHAVPYQLLHAGVPQQEFATKVPLNVHPDLAHAGSDKAVAYGDGCNVQTDFGEVHLSYCIYGASGPLVVLYGDSHALQWLGALLPATENGDMRLALVTADECPPFDPSGLDYRDVCAEWHKLAVARINELDPKLIIASASLSGFELDDDASGAKTSAAVAGLAAELDGAAVLWIVDTPALEQDPAACAAAHVLDITSCATPRGEALPPRLRVAVQRAVIANGWHSLDVNDYLCDKTECGIILGDVFMYRDDDHLSTTFASEFGPVLMGAVSPLINE